MCLRWLIRKFVYLNMTGDDLLKLLPVDLPPHLQTILLLSFRNNGDRWKQDLSQQLVILFMLTSQYSHWVLISVVK